MRVLLLGKDGQVGRELLRSLPALGELFAFGHRELDLTQFEALRDIVRQVAPQLIVNAAAYTDVDGAESEPRAAMAVNAAALQVLAEEANASRAVLVHYSTDYVFDGARSNPYRESDRPNPLNTYGKSKLAGEQAIQRVGGAYLTFRTSWVYSLQAPCFVTNVLRWARQREVLRVVEDQVGSPTWSRSLAMLTTRILSRYQQDLFEEILPLAGVYHLCGKGEVSRFDWAREIIKCDPKKEEQVVRSILPATSAEFPTPAARPPYSALDVRRVERVFDIEVEPWSDMFRRAISEG